MEAVTGMLIFAECCTNVSHQSEAHLEGSFIARETVLHASLALHIACNHRAHFSQSGLSLVQRWFKLVPGGELRKILIELSF